MKKLIMILVSLCAVFTISAKDLEVAVGAGDRFLAKQNPQVAIWLEDTNGAFVKTLYVSNNGADTKTLLPVFTSVAKNNTKVDAETTSTPFDASKLNTVSLSKSPTILVDLISVSIY